MVFTGNLLRRLLIGVSFCILAGNSITLYVGLKGLIEAAEWVRHSLDVKQVLSTVVADLAKAESGQRGYILTGDVHHLDSYYVSSNFLKSNIEDLQSLVSDNASQMDNTAKIVKIIDAKFEEMWRTIYFKSTGEDARAEALVSMNHGSQIMDEFYGAVRDIERIESQLLQERQDNVGVARRAAFIALAGFILAIALLLAILYYLAAREISQKTKASQDIKAVVEELHRQTADLTRERNEIAQLNEASSFLQSCNTVAEISSALPPFMRTMLPDHIGAVYLTAASRNRLDLLSRWGEESAFPHFAPQQCWGLRRGQVHLHEADAAAPLCDHLGGLGSGAMSLCVPLVAHGETIGLLTIWSLTGDAAHARTRRLADMVASQLGLTLANIRLRESLKEQTIRDAMTNAFNRRYLGVVSQKEIAKAKRFSRPMVVAMIDIDHFKRFNDTHGHPAGDAALVRVSQYLQENIRESDWLFRYGGEEFLMILTDTGAQEARVRLDTLRAGIAQMTIRHEGITLPQVTISCGLAAFPTDAEDFDGIVSVADEALYRAKQGGRNCVRLALEDSAALAPVEPQPA